MIPSGFEQDAWGQNMRVTSAIKRNQNRPARTNKIGLLNGNEICLPVRSWRRAAAIRWVPVKKVHQENKQHGFSDKLGNWIIREDRLLADSHFSTSFTERAEPGSWNDAGNQKNERTYRAENPDIFNTPSGGFPLLELECKYWSPNGWKTQFNSILNVHASRWVLRNPLILLLL